MFFTSMLGAIVGTAIVVAFAPEIIVIKTSLVYIVSQMLGKKKHKTPEPQFVDV